jgi:cell wall-associated NlpC family hydrolase
MTVSEQRQAVVAEAMSWIGTPYINNGCIKGRRGGVDCAMLLVGVYGNLGYLPEGFDPRPYSPQWHVHKDEEKYMDYVRKFAHEIPGPPKPGDVAMFLIGKVHAHGAIVTEWPLVVHAMGGDRVELEDVSKMIIGKRALGNVPQRFFTIWGDE